MLKLRTKRFIDLAISTFGLIILCPVLLVAGLLIMIDDGLPIFFKQIRVGKNETPFCLWKLREIRVKFILNVVFLVSLCATPHNIP